MRPIAFAGTARVAFRALMLSVLCVASAGLQAAPGAMTAADARHLLIRTGFAPTQAEVDRVAGRSAQQVVADLLARAKAAKPIHSPPASIFNPPGPGQRPDPIWLDPKI